MMYKSMSFYILLSVLLIFSPVSFSAEAPPPVSFDMSIDIESIIRASGLIGIGLFVVLILAVILVIDNIYYLRTPLLIPENLIEEVDKALDNGEHEKALELCRNRDCLAGKVLASALDKVGFSFERMHGAFQDELTVEAMLWRHRIGRLKLLAKTGLLIGFFGILFNAYPLIAALTIDYRQTANAVSRAILLQDVQQKIYGAATCLLLGLIIFTFSRISYEIFISRIERNIAALRIVAEDILDVFRPLPEDADL